MELIKHLNWRYATKAFDPNRAIAADDLQKLQEAVRLSASSYGLQLYKVLLVQDPELRKALREASWGQQQLTDASEVFVFCNVNRYQPKLVDDYIQLKADIQGSDTEALKGYGDFMKSKLEPMSPEALSSWTAKQTYIALGNLMVACAELKIDACPMEGFDPAQYNEILGLDEQGLSTAVVATVGYRSDEDASQNAPKVRKELDDLFEVRA